ncbi:MAG: metallophosphoesterase [Pseudomonadota bacterium]
MKTSPITRLGAVVIALASLISGPTAWADHGDIAARYVIVTYDPVNEETTTLARVILEGTGLACPAFQRLDQNGDVDGTLNSTTRDNPDEEAFPVTVCEAVMPLGVRAAIDGVVLPSYTSEPERLVVIGDSGCDGGATQDCASEWPFAGIAAHAAAGNPDLVIHVGDWNYRGTPQKEVDGQTTYDSCMPRPGRPWVNTTAGDTWQTWWLDVFEPASALMATAPWVIARGNHELCSRAGRGWFYLLDPRSVLLDPYRALPVCDALTVQTGAYALDLGPIRVVIMDSANACDETAFQDEASFAYQARVYAQQFDQVAALARGSEKPVWLITHHPIWTAVHYEGESEVVQLNAALQRALKQSLMSSLPPSITLVLSGHVHEFQAVTFDDDRPPQLIIGNSGGTLDINLLNSPYETDVDGEPASVLSLSANISPDHFGYLDMTLKADGTMKGEVHSFRPDGTATGRVIAVCSLPVGWDGVCRLGP